MLKAPIVFFAYKRPEHTQRSLESLSQNIGAKDSELLSIVMVLNVQKIAHQLNL